MIFEGSRYSKNHLVNINGKDTISFRKRIEFKHTFPYVFKEGDRLDILAYKYYKDPQLWWIILEANPNYLWEGDIQKGDVINIPSEEEVRAWQSY